MLQTDSNGYVKLAPREAQILRLLCSEAPSNKEIAARLGIAPTTVRDYIASMCDGIHAWTRGALLIWGLQHPEAMLREWCQPTLHEQGCECGGLLCAVYQIIEKAA